MRPAPVSSERLSAEPLDNTEAAEAGYAPSPGGTMGGRITEQQTTSRRLMSRWLGLLLVAGWVLAVVLLVNVLLGGQRVPPSEHERRLTRMTHEQLEDEKLRQEILGLQRNRSVIGGLGPWITATVAVVGVLLTWQKQLADARQLQRESARQQEADRRASEAARREESRQRALDRQQQQAAMEERAAENQRRFQESFTTVALNLGSESASIQASAAVSILSFLRPEHSAFHEQVFLLVLANLKVEHHPEVNKLLVRVFERALRLQLQAGTLDRSLVLDLTGGRLETIDLVGLDLSDADIAFAKLRYGNLRQANLRRVRGYEVDLEKASLSGAETALEEARLRKAHCVETQFHDANLVSARLEEADLTGAEFQRAKLQSAHLDETVLNGTRFEGADLNDAFFRRLREVDDAALRSLSRARNWRNAHFDPEIRERLEALSQSPAPVEKR